MQIDELDVIELKDGRTGAVVDVLDPEKAFLVEIVDDAGKTLDVLTVSKDDISCVIWKSKN